MSRSSLRGDGHQLLRQAKLDCALQTSAFGDGGFEYGGVAQRSGHDQRAF